MKRRSRIRRPMLESLEERLVLSTPPTYPGAPVTLPDQGEWRSSVFGASPVFADLNGDNTQEVIVPASGGRLIAYQSTPNGLAVFQTYQTGSRANFKSTPIVLTNYDGRKMIVAGLGREEIGETSDPVEDGRLFAFDAISGRVLWINDTGLSLKSTVTGVRQSGVYGSLTSGDLDNDWAPEIIATSFSDKITAYRLDGTKIWEYDADDTVLSGAVVADIDRDGLPEVIFGSDASPSQFFHAGGFINVLNSQGALKFKYAVGEVIWSSPTAVDLNNDGYLEIVVGTGINYMVTSPSGTNAASNQVVAIDYQGRTVPGWPYRTGGTTDRRAVYASPAAADLDGDGLPEIIVTDFLGYVHVIRPNGQAMAGWEGGKQLRPSGETTEGSYPSAIVADVNGDGRADIISATAPFLTALDVSGRILFTDVTPTPGAAGSYDQIYATPAVGQFDGRGGLELAIFTNRGDTRRASNQLKLFQLPESNLEPPWPMQRKTETGRAVTYSPDFLRRYISATLRALVSREAYATDIEVFSRMLQRQEFNLRTFAESVARTPESRFVVVKRLYNDYLDLVPTDDQANAGIELLGREPAREFGKQLMLSDRFAALAGNTTEGIALRMFFVTVDRQPDALERQLYIDPVLNGSRTMTWLADQLVRREEFLMRDVIAPVIIAYRGFFPAPSGLVDPAAVAAILVEHGRGYREDDIRAGLIYTGEMFASTSQTASWVRSLYRDVAGIEADTNRVAADLRRFASGETNAQAFARAIVESPEARARFIRDRVRALLKREAEPSLVQLLLNYSNRDDLTTLLASTDEYYLLNGNNPSNFVVALYRDLNAIDLSQRPDVVAPIVQRLTGYTTTINGQRVTVPAEPRSNIVRDVVKGEATHRYRVTELLFEYVPLENQGVLITGNNDPAAGPIVNPDQNLLQVLSNARRAGMSEEEMLTLLTTSAEYFRKTAYFRGFYVKRSIRVAPGSPAST